VAWMCRLDLMVTVKGGKGKGVKKREVENVVKKKVEEVDIEGNEVGKNHGNQPVKKLVWMYRSHEEDLKWAYNGVVASVLNGEAITLVRNIYSEFIWCGRVENY
jgi:hypothetical protein